MKKVEMKSGDYGWGVPGGGKVVRICHSGRSRHGRCEEERENKEFCKFGEHLWKIEVYLMVDRRTGLPGLLSTSRMARVARLEGLRGFRAWRPLEESMRRGMINGDERHRVWGIRIVDSQLELLRGDI